MSKETIYYKSCARKQLIYFKGMSKGSIYFKAMSKAKINFKTLSKGAIYFEENLFFKGTIHISKQWSIKRLLHIIKHCPTKEHILKERTEKEAKRIFNVIVLRLKISSESIVKLGMDGRVLCHFHIYED